MSCHSYPTRLLAKRQKISADIIKSALVIQYKILPSCLSTIQVLGCIVAANPPKRQDVNGHHGEYCG